MDTKEFDNIVIKFTDGTEYNADNSFEDNLNKCIYYKKIDDETLVSFASQYNRVPTTDKDILYCMSKLKNIEEIYYQPIYEGTYLLVYNCDGKWYISTRRCIDAHDSRWNPQSPSHYEIAEKLIDFTKLNPDYVYHYNLISYNNKFILDYTDIFGDKYTKLMLLMVTNKDLTFNKEETLKLTTLSKYENPSEFVNKYSDIKNAVNKLDFNKGIIYIIIYNGGNIFNINVQPDIYNKIYLEVGKCHRYGIADKLIINMIYNKIINIDDSPYLKDKYKDIENDFIYYKMVFNIMSIFIRDFYFIRKSPPNNIKEFYESIPTSYKVILYQIHHDIYINMHKVVTYQNIYKYLMNVPIYQLTLLCEDFHKIVKIYKTHYPNYTQFRDNVVTSLSTYFNIEMLLDYINYIYNYIE